MTDGRRGVDEREFSEAIEAEKKRHSKDHELGVEEDENAGIIKVPFSAEAAGSFEHSPADEGDDEELPGRGMQGGAGKAFKTKAGCEGE